MSNKCQNPPVFRFTWPGKDEDYICAIHAIKMKSTAKAMGLHLQFIRLTPDEMVEHRCYQVAEDNSLAEKG